jgi:hypothetical protein
LAKDGAFQAFETFFDAFDFGFQKVVKIVEASIHRITQVVDACRQRIAKAVNA